MDELMYVLVPIKVDQDKGVEGQYEDLSKVVAELKEQLAGKYDVQGVHLAIGEAAKEIELLEMARNS